MVLVAHASDPGEWLDRLEYNAEQADERVVRVRAVGIMEHNVLQIGREEIRL